MYGPGIHGDGRDRGLRVALGHHQGDETCAGTDIEDGETGSVHVKGVFNLPKLSGAINQGQKVYWYKSSVDANSGITTTAGSNTPAGYAAQAAVSGDTKVLVNLNA